MSSAESSCSKMGSDRHPRAVSTLDIDAFLFKQICSLGGFERMFPAAAAVMRIRMRTIQVAKLTEIASLAKKARLSLI